MNVSTNHEVTMVKTNSNESNGALRIPANVGPTKNAFCDIWASSAGAPVSPRMLPDIEPEELCLVHDRFRLRIGVRFFYF